VLFDITQLALERAIEGAGKRHQALAANLASANTPNYQRVDVEFDATIDAREPINGFLRQSQHDRSTAEEADTALTNLAPPE
jgi:flagellar basal body rod protein FlgB